MVNHSAADVEALCALMQKYGLSRLQHGTLVLERPLHVILPPELADKKPETEELDEFDKVQAMTPEAQDAYLSLSPERAR